MTTHTFGQKRRSHLAKWKEFENNSYVTYQNPDVEWRTKRQCGGADNKKKGEQVSGQARSTSGTKHFSMSTLVKTPAPAISLRIAKIPLEMLIINWIALSLASSYESEKFGHIILFVEIERAILCSHKENKCVDGGHLLGQTLGTHHILVESVEWRIASSSQPLQHSC